MAWPQSSDLKKHESKQLLHNYLIHSKLYKQQVYGVKQSSDNLLVAATADAMLPVTVNCCIVVRPRLCKLFSHTSPVVSFSGKCSYQINISSRENNYIRFEGNCLDSDVDSV